jgi:hypothetical protein
MALLVTMLVVAMVPKQGAEAKCPYSALWMENSPNKLPDDHPAMQLYLGPEGGAETTETHSSRTLMQANGTTAAADAYKKGAGTCKYVNPFTQSETCVQLTGSAWSMADAAIQWCEEGGIGLPGAVGNFEKDAVCPGFADEQFGGVCVNDAGTEEETASVFVVVPGNVMSSCDTTIMGCETFGGGTWVQAGGQCSKEGSEEALTAVIGSDTNETLAEGECKIQPGIAGGGHMDRDAFWSSKCTNSNSSYSMPRRWMADTETVTTQNKISRTVGHVWYDLENNRRREDSMLVEGELNVFQESYNTTFLHFGPIFYMIAWDDPDNVTCVKMNSPVGILRPNWIIDGEGYQSVAQYLGTEYVIYEGRYRRVKKFRKTEPLEDAYMIQNYDDEDIWATPEGDKRRPLIRMTPGAPFQGDAVNLYFNHSTDFSDDVFDIYKDLNCTERDRGDSAFEEFREENPELFESADGGAPGLNFNSSFHVDSSVQTQECEECDIVYQVRAVEGEEEEDSSPDTIDIASGGDSSDGDGRDAAADFEGSQEVTSDVFVDWKYTSSNKTLSVRGTLDKDAWFSIAFPEIECQMSPAISVIAIPEEDGETVGGTTYNINFNSMSGIQESNDIEDIFAVETFKQGDGKVVIQLEKTVENGFSAPLSVTWAHGDTRELGYHFSEGRGCFSISPQVQ